MAARPARAGAIAEPPAHAGTVEDFRLLADGAPVMMWVAGPDGRCVHVNRPWLEFTGEAPGARAAEDWAEPIHPDDRARRAAALAGALAHARAFEIEYRLRRADGEYRWLLEKGLPLMRAGTLAGFVASCVDITPRIGAQEEARQCSRDFQTLADNIPDGIVRLDRELRVRFANRALERAFGAAPGRLLGAPLRESALPAAVAEAFERAAALAFESAAEQHLRFDAQADGQRRHFAARAIPEADAHGHAEAVLVIVYDETARAREDEKRERSLERERNARADAESATAARDQFLSLVSHELRSPLNGIKSWTHVLENVLRDPDPAVRRALAGIMVGVEHQVKLIDGLLDVTRAMSGNLTLFKQPMPLLPVLADAVESMRSEALERDLRIVTDYRLGEHEIHGDPERVRQVFANLVANAIKFTPPGGTVWVSARVERTMARVEVRDDGAGIPAEFLPYLFDPFRQAEPGARGRRHAGLGLGLALAQRLAELHGGYVSCESAGADRGATFRVYLPLRRDAGARVALADSPPTVARDGPSLPSLAGIRVLLIDDQREARESLGALLAQAGAEVTLAASGQEALAHLALNGDARVPEVIVCDIAMPVEDGYATLERIRRWEAAKPGRGSRPAIAVSAFNQREDRMRALARGFQTHLTKPVAPAELVVVIASLARA